MDAYLMDCDNQPRDCARRVTPRGRGACGALCVDHVCVSQKCTGGGTTTTVRLRAAQLSCRGSRETRNHGRRDAGGGARSRRTFSLRPAQQPQLPHTAGPHTSGAIPRLRPGQWPVRAEMHGRDGARRAPGAHCGQNCGAHHSGRTKAGARSSSQLQHGSSTSTTSSCSTADSTQHTHAHDGALQPGAPERARPGLVGFCLWL